MADVNLKQNQNEKKMSSFLKRLISGIVLVILAILFVTSGGYALLAACFLISMIGLFELYRVFGIEKRSIGYVGYLTTILYYGLLISQKEDYIAFMIIISLMALMTFYVITFPEYRVEVISKAFMGICYVGVMFSYLYKTREMADGTYLVWLIFLSSWGCDTCAYCTGMLFGRHKMAPKLSPKKSVEGGIGGILGAALLGVIYAAFFGKNMNEVSNPYLACAVACAIAAVISQIGDLTASAIKRNYEIKDYGHLIPGHGGVLDRFDSMIFTAPAIYFALTFFS